MLGVPAAIAGCEVARAGDAAPPRRRESTRTSSSPRSCAGVTHVIKSGRRAGDRRARRTGRRACRRSTRSSARATPGSRRPSSRSREDPDGAACDLPAGPSEVMVIADDSADAKFVAADLLAQAEHGRGLPGHSRSQSRALLVAVAAELEAPARARAAPRNRAPALAHERVLARDERPVAERSRSATSYAPEHLILQTREDARRRAKASGTRARSSSGLDARDRGRLRERHEPRPADVRLRARLRRAQDRELPQVDHVPGNHGRRSRRARARLDEARRARGARGARQRGSRTTRGAKVMSEILAARPTRSSRTSSPYESARSLGRARRFPSLPGRQRVAPSGRWTDAGLNRYPEPQPRALVGALFSRSTTCPPSRSS